MKGTTVHNFPVFLAICLISAQAWLGHAVAAREINIGFATTLSGISADIGQDIHDGFMLGYETYESQLSEYDIKIHVRDDERNLGRATRIMSELLYDKQIDIATGVIWSDLAISVIPNYVRNEVLYLSSNAGPSALAGKYCHQNYFNMSWQNDILHEAVGYYLHEEGYEQPYVIAPNYPAGVDGLNGFKRKFQKKPKMEHYVRLGEVNYVELLQDIEAQKPDSIYFFLPGKMGIAFLRQVQEVGLDIPLFGPGFSLDQTILRNVGEIPLGVLNASQWSPDMKYPANLKFMDDFERRYQRLPSMFAAQAYDTAILLFQSLSRIVPEFYSLDRLRTEVRKADFKSVRGKFRFGNNQHPIQDVYIRKVIKKDDKVTNKLETLAIVDSQDFYHLACDLSF